jgi:protoporphyrinogen/coproporphyrinogen III oxidase
VRRVLVVGGGVAGLAAALGVRDRAAALGTGVEVRVLEAGERPGGNLRTLHEDGFTVEWGPNGFLDNAPATLALVGRLGLEPELQPADALAARRFLFRRGRLHELRAAPLAFFASPLLSLGGRLRLLGEPWTRPKPEGHDETVHEFAARHLGEEAATVLVGAMVSGVFAGDARSLSLASAFPKMAEMDAEHGSLVRAMLAKARARRAARRRLAELRARGEEAPELERAGGPAGPGGTLTSFRRGIETLVDGLVAALDGAVATGAAGGGAHTRRRREPLERHARLGGAARGGRRGRRRSRRAGGAAPRAARRRARRGGCGHPIREPGGGCAGL